MLRLLAVGALVALLGGGVAGLTLYRQLIRFRDMPFGSDAEKVVEVPPGSSARQIMRSLGRAQVVSSERLAWRYLRLLKRDKRPMRAGEYAFAGPMRPDEVLEKIYRGEVRTYRFTVPEGLRVEEIATIIERSGLGKVSELLPLMHDPNFAHELGVPSSNLEGYLFPDTYAFAKGPKPSAVLGAMVGRFREVYRQAEAQRLPDIRLTEGEAVTLASIIEKETGRAEERPRISCVFHNRLRKGMRLQTDPTVMYATMLRNGGRWSQNITKADLLASHPYNTYTVAGLPPGPIASPGQAALNAALHPSDCSDLFFVSRNDGSHVFCRDLTCHEAAVRKWQIEFLRARRAVAEPAAAQPPPPRANGSVRKRTVPKKQRSGEQTGRARGLSALGESTSPRSPATGREGFVLSANPERALGYFVGKPHPARLSSLRAPAVGELQTGKAGTIVTLP